MLLLVLVMPTLMYGLSLKCASSDLNETFTRGDTMALCLHFIDLKTMSSQRLAYSVKVDRYTAIHAAGGTNWIITIAYTKYSQLGIQNMSISVQANKDQTPSPQIPYLLNATNVFPLYSLVIEFTDGNVTDLIWDNGCWSGSSLCYDYMAGAYDDSNNYVESCGTGNESSSCDPKIYVSFIGSDASGNYMESAGKRISQFRQYSVGEMYSSSKSIFSSYVSDAQNSVQ